MADKICVGIGDMVRNVHTGEIFVVEQVFKMRKVSGGKYTPNNSWEQDQLLYAGDWLIEKTAQQSVERTGKQSG